MARPTGHAIYYMFLLRHSYCLTLLLLRSYITRANFRRTKFEKAQFTHTSHSHFVVRIVQIQRSANFEAMGCTWAYCPLLR